uniref:RRP15-like protein n=1 Tax=Kalanchoe fedtschenkoi TaxID=63787 RepID=A0A7N0RJ65_KALFE
MGEDSKVKESGKAQKRKRIGYSKGHKGAKKPKVLQGSGKKVKVDGRMKKLYRKRAREYNSDDDDDGNDNAFEDKAEEVSIKEKMNDERDADELDSENDEEKRHFVDDDEEEEGEIQSGVTKFVEGVRAFKLAFKKIMKRNISDDSLGPVLSGHQKLVAEKLAEEEADRKVKGEAKKEKQLVKEKGHLIPESFFDAHEKFLIGVARKGVVKLFNAVNKAQLAQKGLNPSRTKDAKELSKKRKESFFSELGRKPFSHSTSSKSGTEKDEDGPAWAPLRDNYMLTNSKLKNWDKQQHDAIAADNGRAVIESSDDDE